MDVLAETYLINTPLSITGGGRGAKLSEKKEKNQLSMRDVPLEQTTEYAVEECRYHFSQLASTLDLKLKEANTKNYLMI